MDTVGSWGVQVARAPCWLRWAWGIVELSVQLIPPRGPRFHRVWGEGWQVRRGGGGVAEKDK